MGEEKLGLGENEISDILKVSSSVLSGTLLMVDHTQSSKLSSLYR